MTTRCGIFTDQMQLFGVYVSVNSNWVHPPGNSRGLAEKVARGPGIRQGPGFCGKWNCNFKKIAWIKFLQVKTQKPNKTSRVFDLFRGLRVFSTEFFLVYGSFVWFYCHAYLTKFAPGLFIWSFHWVMVIHTHFCIKSYDYNKHFVRVLAY